MPVYSPVGVTRDDTQWIKYAMQLACHASDQGEVPVGAVVVDADGQLIGEGWNQPISTCDPTAHAEIVALRAAARHLGNYRLSGASLYVTLEPCQMCAGAMVHARIGRLVFGAHDPRRGAVESVARTLDAPELNHRVTMLGGVLEDACAQQLQAFFRLRRT
jgi:tRNA(adenine34) deaminase